MLVSEPTVSGLMLKKKKQQAAWIPLTYLVELLRENVHKFSDAFYLGAILWHVRSYIKPCINSQLTDQQQQQQKCKVKQCSSPFLIGWSVSVWLQASELCLAVQRE